MKNILLLLLLLPTILLSQTINIKNNNYYVTINTVDSVSLDEDFNPNVVDVTSWGDEYTHIIDLDTINQEVSFVRNCIKSNEKYSNQYIILEKINTEEGLIYTLGGYDGSYAFIYLNEFTAVFGVESEYGIYRGILGYIN